MEVTLGGSRADRGSVRSMGHRPLPGCFVLG